jgi:hypothetical protein
MMWGIIRIGIVLGGGVLLLFCLCIVAVSLGAFLSRNDEDDRDDDPYSV